MSNPISADQLKHLAELSRIALSEEEVQTYALQLNSVLNYIDILNEVDVTGVEMTTQVTGLTNSLREDQVQNLASPDELLDCSPLTKLNHSIAVKAIIKEE